MPPEFVNPPWDYLCVASEPSLQSYELSCLNHAANLRKEVAVLVDQWVENHAYALLARWLLDHWTYLQAPNPQGDLFAESACALPTRRSTQADAAD